MTLGRFRHRKGSHSRILAIAQDLDQVSKQLVGDLALQGVYVGTSSWKYEGWLGRLYTRDRYSYRGKVASSRFERDCLKEYAEVFKAVSVDVAYYDFPQNSM